MTTSPFQRSSVLLKSYTLPCGVEISNRISKAAMTERLADNNNFATTALNNLYEKWSNSGTGLLISGNIMVDKRYKESSGNIAVEDESGLDQLSEMADMAEAGFYDYQIHQIAKNKTLKPNYNPFKAIIRMTKNELVKGWF